MPQNQYTILNRDIQPVTHYSFCSVFHDVKSHAVLLPAFLSQGQRGVVYSV